MISQCKKTYFEVPVVELRDAWTRSKLEWNET